jgi:hypothetical protein
MANRDIAETLGHVFNHNDKAIAAAVTRIGEIKQRLEQTPALQNFSFIGSSLFITYDPAHDTDSDSEQDTEQNRQGKEALEIKIIDFLHCIHYETGQSTARQAGSHANR